MGDAVDVLAVGRLGVDLYPLQTGVGLDEAETFSKSLGGTAANVAVAAARHGRRSALISATGDDPFGRYLHAELRRFGVDDRYVGRVPGLNTPVTFCEIFPPEHFPLYFYREPIAPDLTIGADLLDPAAIAGAGLFWLTATGLSREPSRSTHHRALALRGRVRRTVLDLDYRPMFWESAAAASAQLDQVLDQVTVVVGNREECAVATGHDDPDRAAEALLARGLELAVVKLGGEGVLAMNAAGERTVIAPHRVSVVNGLGAGDGFGGALCHGLLSGWPLAETIAFASTAGALVAAERECSTAMPTTEQVRRAMARDQGHGTG